MAKLLDFILASRTEYFDDVERLCKPDSFESKDELNEHFEDVLGYAPERYMNEKEIIDYFNDALKHAPFSVQEQMLKNKDEIITRTLDIIEEVDSSLVCKIFCNVCKSVVGWDAAKGTDTIDNIINSAIFKPNGIPDWEEDDEEDEDEDYFDESFDDDNFDDESDEDD